MDWMTGLDWLLLTAGGGFFLLMVFSSLVEGEKRAALLSSLAWIGYSVIWIFMLANRGLPWVRRMHPYILALMLLFILVSLVPLFPRRAGRLPGDIARFDERDHMFSRNNLKFHPELAAEYYARHPERKGVDEKIHHRPELGDEAQIYHDPVYSPLFEAAFAYLDKTRPASQGDTRSRGKGVEADVLTRAVRDAARFYGACDVGIARLQRHHLYSHTGRRAEGWGQPVENSHTHAVVVVVPMSVGMMKRAPALPAILESSRQYVEAAKIAHVVAEYLRGLGFSARSHTDGNYQILCVPLAVAAGLGELGRMGIFLHRIHGPCVRLAVVTCDAELIPDSEGDWKMAAFCQICRKCAINCPTQAIPSGDEPVSRGVRHWSIVQETCYAFWKSAGTDCGFCIRVCPYTKPNTLLHRLVRFYISRNPINQRIALFFDDLLYGRRLPRPRGNPRRLISE